MKEIIRALEELKMFLITSQVTRLEAADILTPIILELKENHEGSEKNQTNPESTGSPLGLES